MFLVGGCATKADSLGAAGGQGGTPSSDAARGDDDDAPDGPGSGGAGNTATGGTAANNPGAGGMGEMGMSGAGGATTACDMSGGNCTGVGDCGVGRGHLSPVSCNAGPGVACCVPQGQCGAATETFTCCSDAATFRPACIGDQLTCLPGHMRC
jgi:hypothetical protein